MPDLLASLLQHDIGHLRIIAELWGLELDSSTRDSAAQELSASLLDVERLAETMDILSAEARAALDALSSANGRIPLVDFSRRFGLVREMGAAKRDREQPQRNPASPAEALFYRGLLAIAFFDTERGAQEFAYVPDDLILLINHRRDGRPPVPKSLTETLGRAATPIERTHIMPASDRILDDATTLLAALRIGINLESGGLPPNMQEQAPAFQTMLALLQSAKLIKKNSVQAEVVKKFLEASRADALTQLAAAWETSVSFDELRLVPSLVCEGEWTDDPLTTRRALLGFVSALPQNQWWSLSAFLRDLKEKHPHFQRPAGDYDSWFIKRAADGEYLRGFVHWDEVEGALVRFFIQVSHLLGMVDLASPQEGKDFTAFRIRSNVEGQTSGDARRLTFDESGKIAISSNGKITVSRLAPRAVRYQIARFCEWDAQKTDEYIYRVSARSLTNALAQGLKAEQLLTLLVKFSKGNVPPALVQSLKRWAAHGTEARAETLSVLRVARPEALTALRKSKAARFLGESLGPTAVIVKEGAMSKVEAALAEMGLLVKIS